MGQALWKGLGRSLELTAQAGRQVPGTQDRWREATDPTLQKRV